MNVIEFFLTLNYKKIYEDITKLITSSKQTRDLLEIIEKEKYRDIIIELDSQEKLKLKYWIYYLQQSKEEYEQLISVYDSGKTQLKKIQEEATNEEAEWRNVVTVFTQRFSTVPFRIDIINQADVILKNDIPVPKLTYKGEGDLSDVVVDETTLDHTLSNGEKRAYYLLRIIFDIEARRKEGKTTLIIIDDIADSFDYANKYAILEYLQEIVQCPTFRSIILTHNFDFYRSLYSRLLAGNDGRKHSLISIKETSEIKLVRQIILKTPLK